MCMGGDRNIAQVTPSDSYLLFLVSPFKPAKIGVLWSAKNQLLWILPGIWSLLYTATVQDVRWQTKLSRKPQAWW